MSVTGRKNSEQRNIVDVETRKFILDNETLEKVSNMMGEEFLKGLSKDSSNNSCLPMILTYVRDIPNGTEEGKYLALDLGGSNFRILCIELFKNSTEINIEYETFKLTNTIMEGTGTELFDYIAECLDTFIKAKKLDKTCLPLGFTFSFPCLQDGVVSAKLIRWTKGFSCSGVVDQDIAQLLREAIHRKGINLHVMAIVNDTTGTLMSCAHIDRNCRVGVIIGTGTNACYMECLDNVEKWTPEETDPPQVIVNTEWCAFGDNSCINFIRTKYDNMIDENSLNPKQQVFEKMVSGMYLGEIVRRVIVDLTNYELLFKGVVNPLLNTPYAFQTQWLTLIEDDVAKKRNRETAKILKTFDIKEISDEDCEIIKLISTRVVERSACLISAGIAAILNKMKRPQTTIGVDGPLYRKHPIFKRLMETKIKKLTCPNYKFSLMLSQDGSGRGAALVAAVLHRKFLQAEEAEQKKL